MTRREQNVLRLHAQLAHAREVLADAQETLLAPVDHELGPVLEILVNHLHRLLLVRRTLDFLPQMLRGMRSLDRFHAPVH